MNNIKLFALPLLLIIVSTIAFGNSESADIKKTELQTFPELPVGYSWVIHRGVAIPKPDTWFEHRAQGTYATSVESVKEQGIFETGATIQVIRNTQDIYGAPASVIAISLIQDIKNKEENTILILNNQEIGDFKTFTLRYNNSPISAKPIIVHKFIMANDKDSFVNIITFESSEDEWSQYWKKEGVTIFKRILVVTYDENRQIN